jgi:pyruvate/2-oxoglutarate/acetoin dehydrogenase E1 component
LAKEGISIEIVDPRTLNPLDIQTLAGSLRKTGRVIIAHDGYRTGGVGAEIAQRLTEEAFDYLDAPIVRLAGRDVPVPSGDLHPLALPHCEDLVKAGLRLVGRHT